MPTVNPPFQNQTLGISPETLNQFWQQFQIQGCPNGLAVGTIASDLSVTLPLTNAQLLALQTTAVQLVAPPVTTGGTISLPPNGFLYVPSTLTLEYRFATAAFTLGNADNRLQVEYTGQTANLISVLATGLLTLTANAVTTNQGPDTGTITTLATSANLGLEIKLAGTTPALTVGGGTVVVHMLYNLYALI